MKLHEMPNEQRPRTRLFERGPGARRDAELLAVLLPTGPKGACALQVAEELMARFRDLPSIARAPVEELAKVPGVGEVKAAQIHAAIEIGVRLARRRAAANKFDDASRIAELVGPEMRLLPAENARVVLLNAKLHLIAVEDVSRGLLDQALVHAREVFAPAIARRAYAVVLAHNHPSGDPTPSEADIRITRALRESSKVLDIPLLDHVIIGAPSTAYPEGWFSFKAAGYL
ncbi:MAG: DNA repair protein RadC [Verrucomicrobiae bacterium]|nr:DNA repair protein RadC [Verrucomicrobiae bacterium]